MSYCHYDRLSALDSAFLDLEDGNAHMHIGAVALFDAGSLARPEGGIDFERILDSLEGALHSRDLFQRKLARVPLVGQRIWVDDASFNLRYHVRHTCLPAPGDARLLKRLAGRIMSEELDRGKPLWELWFVEGVEGGRFAVISKIHHALADGIAGVDLLSAILTPDPEQRPPGPRNWIPRPEPTARRLLWDELQRRARMPFTLARIGTRAVESVGETLAEAGQALEGIGEALESSLRPAPETPFNQSLGPHRRVDWTRFDLAEAKEASRRLGGTLNDLVLCVVAGAAARFMQARGLRVGDRPLQALVPVSRRGVDERGAPGRAAMVLVPLAMDATGPRERFERVSEASRAAKRTGRKAGSEILAEIADWASSGALARLARFGTQSRIANFVVTNVSGPETPVFLLGARMQETYPVVPLATNHGLGIALMSYAGSLYWGLNADWDLLPDLHEFVAAIDAEYEQLRALAGESRRASAPRKSARKRRGTVASSGARRG